MKRGLLLSSLFLSLFLCLICSASSQIYINEVMPRGAEWVEIFNSENVLLNLSEWNISDSNSIDTITCWTIPNCSIITNSSYFLIIGRSNNISQITNETITYYYVDDTKIGNGLNDNGDNLSFFNISYQTDMSYNSSLENFSISRFPDGNENWTFCTPTPGLRNCNDSDEQNQSNDSNDSNESFFPMINLTFSQQVYNNETPFIVNANLINFSQGFYDLKLDIKNNSNYLNRVWYNNEWSDEGSWLDDFPLINNSNYSINTLSIIDKDERFIGNATLKLSLRNKTNIYYSEIYNITITDGIQENNPENNSQQNNSDEDENSNEDSDESSIKISDSPNKAKFGQKIDVKLEIYRGSTNKYAVYVYIEDDKENRVSEKETLHLTTKYENYKKTVSLDLDCLDKSGNYKIVAEGLDNKDTERIYLDPCHAQTEDSPNEKINELLPLTSEQPVQISDLGTRDLVTGSITQNPGEKSENNFPIIIVDILVFLTILLTMIVFLKRAAQ